MYVCSACRRPVGPRVPLRKLVISKNRQVRQELPLCGSCLAAHKDGVTLSDLYGRRSVTQAG